MRGFVGDRHLIRQPRALHEGIRDYPTYSIHDAAQILAMPRRTLQGWVYDKPFFTVAGSSQPQKLLSFKDLAQFYFLQFVRRHARLTDSQARKLLQYTKEITHSEYPLLHENIQVFPKHVFWEHKSRDSKEKRILELVRPKGQYVFQEVVSMFASRVDRDPRGLMLRLYPWRLWRSGDERRPVSVDPYVMSGKLVITGTRIPAVIIATRRKQGESVRDIAKDYDLSQRIVTQSLRHFAIRKAA
jgi:uncharacterized protein (DUF433 family)